MKLYCIYFRREYKPEGNMEHRFFVYAKTKTQAIKRFCVTTGYKKACIISIHII